MADEASLILEDAVDGAMGPVPSDIDDCAFHDELSFDLPDNDLIEETSISPFASERPDDAVDDVMGSVLKDAEDSAVEEELPPGLLANFVIGEIQFLPFDLLMTYDAVDDAMGSMRYDDISDGTVSKAAVSDRDMDDLVRSMLENALTRGSLDSEDLILDDFMDQLMWSMLYDAISGRSTAEPVDAFHDMMTCLLHDVFFGPAASNAVSSWASAGDIRLGVNDYVQAVAGLYDEVKEMRYRRTTEPATAEGVAGEASLKVDNAVDDVIGSVSHDIDDRAYYEELPFDLAADGLIDEMHIWPFDPGMTEHAAADEFTSVLYGDISDGAASEAVLLDDPVNDVVFSVVRDALARGTTSEDLMLDAAMDDLMWSMLHNAISGRAASESENLADGLDEVVTCLLHDVFFGPEAAKTVSALATNADASQLVVDGYVRAVTKQYDAFKEVCYRTSTYSTNRFITLFIPELYEYYCTVDISEGRETIVAVSLMAPTPLRPRTVFEMVSIVRQLAVSRYILDIHR